MARLGIAFHGMVFSRVRVENLAYELPSTRVTSRSIEASLAETYARLGIPQGCIEMLVGVLERRFWDEGNSDIATLAAKADRAVYEQSGRAAELRARTGLVVSTSVSKDFIEPSVAALVRGQLQLPAECDAFDVGNACLGFLNGIELASQQIELGLVDVALVVAAESSRHCVSRAIEKLRAPTATMAEFKETLPTLTLGSGTVAMLLVHDSIASTAHRVIGSRNFRRIVFYSADPWKLALEPAKPPRKTSFEVTETVLEAAPWRAELETA